MPVGECREHRHGHEHHLKADEVVLQACADHFGSVFPDLLDHSELHHADEHYTLLRIQSTQYNSEQSIHYLPECDEDHKFDAEELPKGLMWRELLFQRMVELHERVKREGDRDVQNEQDIYIRILQREVRFFV